MGAARILGGALTAIGLLLFAYAIIAGLVAGAIGSRSAWTPEAVAVLTGWFMLLIGPALYFGKKPAKLASR